MGIDARMLVRTMQTYTDTELRQIASRMCATIGHDKFFLQDGSSSWHTPGGRHALSVEPETVGAWLAEHNEDDGYDWRSYYSADEIEAVERADPSAPCLSQDGPPLIGEVGETFITVHLWGRYYGPGYERGDWPTIRATAEFLEHAFGECSVWYGGDSSGVCAELFDEAARKRINDHYLSVGHEPYRGAFGMWGKSGTTPVCDFCGGRPMNNCGGRGMEATFYTCDGCGKNAVKDETTGAVFVSEKGEKDNGFGFTGALAKLDAARAA